VATTSTKKSDEGDAAPSDATTWSRERLLAEARVLTGSPRHVVAGALTLLPQRKEEFTVDEVKAAVQKYNNRKVEG
jgi:hypothetical protein